MLCDNEAAKGSIVRIMPDVHPGKAGVIGLTMTVGQKVLPNLVGIDIGCGITITKVKQKKIEFRGLILSSGKIFQPEGLLGKKNIVFQRV